jgi:hypothetical protein
MQYAAFVCSIVLTEYNKVVSGDNLTWYTGFTKVFRDFKYRRVSQFTVKAISFTSIRKV